MTDVLTLSLTNISNVQAADGLRWRKKHVNVIIRVSIIPTCLLLLVLDSDMLYAGLIQGNDEHTNTHFFENCAMVIMRFTVSPSGFK